MKKKIVVLSGAGISAESGLGTFRDSGGLWEKFDIQKVATIQAWQEDPKLVLSFYNARRAQVLTAKPNKGHFALVDLEKKFDVSIITQNIDDLHERAGSSNVIHLHGEIKKARSVKTDKILYPIEGDIKLGDLTPSGEQLRPHVVWFGEAVPKMDEAEALVKSCDILIIVGTSLNVYPAAGLVFSCGPKTKKILIDPNEVSAETEGELIHLKGKASEQLPILVNNLLQSEENYILS